MKCIKANMQISWVLSENERDRRFNKLKKVSFRNNLLKPDEPSTPEYTVALTRPPEITFTTEELLFLDQVRTSIRAFTSPRYEQFFRSEPETYKHLGDVSFFGGVVNYNYWNKYISASDTFSQGVLLNLEAMNQLCLEDRYSLIKANGLPAYCFMESIYTDEEDTSLCVCLDILHRLRLTNNTPVIRYESIYTSPWASNYDDEQRHRHLMERMKSWAFPDRDTKRGILGFDPYLTLLMRMIIAFSTDNVNLQDRVTCERVRHQCSMMLYRYMKNKLGIQANQKFREAMDICSNAQETASIIKRRLPV